MLKTAEIFVLEKKSNVKFWFSIFKNGGIDILTTFLPQKSLINHLKTKKIKRMKSDT